MAFEVSETDGAAFCGYSSSRRRAEMALIGAHTTPALNCFDFSGARLGFPPVTKRKFLPQSSGRTRCRTAQRVVECVAGGTTRGSGVKIIQGRSAKAGAPRRAQQAAICRAAIARRLLGWWYCRNRCNGRNARRAAASTFLTTGTSSSANTASTERCPVVDPTWVPPRIWPDPRSKSALSLKLSRLSSVPTATAKGPAGSS